MEAVSNYWKGGEKMAKRKTDQTNFLLQLLILTFLLFAIPATMYAFGSFRSPSSRAAKKAITGSGSPSGPHYNLNIIGVPKNKTSKMTGSKGHRIFVKLDGKTKISLSEGDNYQVLDANGTDGKAVFQLPNPDPDNDGVTKYSVWARPLGKPGGRSTTTTCALDEFEQEWCSTEALVVVREKGKSKFSDVSKQLLYIYVDLDGDGYVERYPIFDPALLEYFWSYNNEGLKLLQLRFYEVVSNVN